MPWTMLLLVACAGGASGPAPVPAPAPVVPALVLGQFRDDYGVSYEITEQLWRQGTRTVYHIERWDPEARFLIARNDAKNQVDGGKWTRIDWLELPGMPPWEWAYCYTTWSAGSAEAAAAAAPARRAEPRSGCGGHPFSRMQRADSTAAAPRG